MDCSREMLEAIIAEVMERIKHMEQPGTAPAQGKRLLVLLSGGMLGAQDAREQLKLIRADGHQMKALFTAAGETVLGATWLHESLPDVPVIPSNAKESPRTLLAEADAVLVPVLTFNTAAKVVCGIADNPVTSVFLHALLQGKPIFAAGDACDPNHPLLASSGNRNMVYRNRLKDNVQQLEQYGIHIVRASELHHAINTAFKSERGNVGQESSELSLQSNNNSEAKFSGPVLSVSTVSQWPLQTLIASKKTLITPAAKDFAHNRGIQIIVES